MEKKEYFLFQDSIYKDPSFEYVGWHPDAYFIIPSELGYDIFHQYGCAGCYHFKIKGFAVPVPDPKVAKILEKVLGCDCQYNSYDVNLVELWRQTGIEIETIQSEALAKLKNGWYVATCNCD